MKASLFGQRQGSDYSAYTSSYIYPNSYWNSYQRNPYANPSYGNYQGAFPNVNYPARTNYSPSNIYNPSKVYNPNNIFNPNNSNYAANKNNSPFVLYPCSIVVPRHQGYLPVIYYGNPFVDQKEALLNSDGLEKILIAILILVALDLIFIRSR